MTDAERQAIHEQRTTIRLAFASRPTTQENN